MARYRDAIEWIADNDDTDFIYDERGSISVTLALVIDLFNKTEEQAIKDLRRALDKGSAW